MSLLAFVSDVLLVIESDVHGSGDDRIVIALVRCATTFLAGVIFFGPEVARIGKLTAEGAPGAERTPWLRDGLLGDPGTACRVAGRVGRAARVAGL